MFKWMRVEGDVGFRLISPHERILPVSVGKSN